MDTLKALKKVEKGKVTSQVEYLSAIDEEKFTIAQPGYYR